MSLMSLRGNPTFGARSSPENERPPPGWFTSTFLRAAQSGTVSTVRCAKGQCVDGIVRSLAERECGSANAFLASFVSTARRCLWQPEQSSGSTTPRVMAS